LYANTTGGNNTAVGSYTADAITTADDCTAVGQGSLTVATTGSSNTALGKASLHLTTTGAENTALGASALYANTTGVENTAVGKDTGTTITTGSRNTIIGDGSDVSAAGGNDQMLFGRGLTGKGDDTFFVGGANGAYQHNNSSSWSTTSDRRIKKNIVDNTTGLDKINQIRVRNFEYRNEEEIVDFDNPKAAVINKKGTQLGVIAQEIENILPDVVKTQSTGVKTVNPDNLTWYLVNAIKELSAKVAALEAG